MLATTAHRCLDGPARPPRAARARGSGLWGQPQHFSPVSASSGLGRAPPAPCRPPAARRRAPQPRARLAGARAGGACGGAERRGGAGQQRGTGAGPAGLFCQAAPAVGGRRGPPASVLRSVFESSLFCLLPPRRLLLSPCWACAMARMGWRRCHSAPDGSCSSRSSAPLASSPASIPPFLRRFGSSRSCAST